MFNPHIHQQQQQQQQQQFHQHLRQLQQLFQQQPPPPPPPQPPPGHHVAHHHQTRALAVPPQTAPPPRMVNLCQATQTTIIAPNPMLQGALLMQQMQGNMRGFGMGGQQFRQFFTAGARSSLLGPVPMGMAIKSPMMGFPAARSFHPHARYYNNTPITTSAPTTAATSSSISDSAARVPDRKRDSDQMEAGSSDEQTAAASSTSEASDKPPADGAVGGLDEPIKIPEEEDEPVVKKQRTEGGEKSKDPSVVETISITDPDGVFPEDFISNTESEDCVLLEDEGFIAGSDNVATTEETRADEVRCSSAPSPSGRSSEDNRQTRSAAEETSQDKDATVSSPENQEEEEGAGEGANKFYCYLCSITCHNQHNFRSHMNSISHQQRMMEIQHMSNACLVTLLPRVQESLQGANKDGERKSDSKRWCSTCHAHFTGSVTDHRRTMEHKLASRTDISSCAVCKKHFKTSQAFLEHLQSHEHRQKLQEKGCEALSKLAALDTDGFSLEEEEGSEVEDEAEGRQSNEGGARDAQDGWSSFKEVTLDDMTSDEQYDPDTVYGSSFLVPVAGFICGLCNKFYHFEASALHTHCKSPKHFENLKSYRALMRQKGEAVASPGEFLAAADGLGPASEASTDCPEDFLSDDTGVATKPLQPSVVLTRLDQEGDEPTSQDSDHTDQDLSLFLEEAEGSSQASVAQESPAEGPAGSSQEADSEPAAAEEDHNEEEEEGEEEEITPGRRNATAKAKPTTKRKSGRAANRR